MKRLLVALLTVVFLGVTSDYGNPHIVWKKMLTCRDAHFQDDVHAWQYRCGSVPQDTDFDHIDCDSIEIDVACFYAQDVDDDAEHVDAESAGRHAIVHVWLFKWSL